MRGTATPQAVIAYKTLRALDEYHLVQEVGDGLWKATPRSMDDLDDLADSLGVLDRPTMRRWSNDEHRAERLEYLAEVVQNGC